MPIPLPHFTFLNNLECDIRHDARHVTPVHSRSTREIGRHGAHGRAGLGNTMTTITDEQLDLHAARLRGKVAVITGAAAGIGRETALRFAKYGHWADCADCLSSGAAAGIGRETALRFAKYGARIVIGDLDVQGAHNVIAEVVQAGSQGAVLKCDVTSWEDQVALFELAMKQFGSVDVVVANAGVNEMGEFLKPQEKDGKPVKPTFKTLDINLTGSLYTAYVGMHYLRKGKKQGDLKSIVLIGSMASWQAPTNMPMYAASKHGVLGFMRAVYPNCRREGIRISVIHPWFADTKIVPPEFRRALQGMPETPLHRIAGAILCKQLLFQPVMSLLIHVVSRFCDGSGPRDKRLPMAIA
ncbi:hypothetical protein HWV62_19063 [Athelia sp. TMB]|nr:hypothetical protein HWV62_19063 [Athelia sp. TMB]